MTQAGIYLKIIRDVQRFIYKNIYYELFTIVRI